MPITTVQGLLTDLRQFHLLDAKQLDELTRKVQGKNIEPRALAQKLIAQGWLTAYQVNQLLHGRGAQLLLGAYVLLERLGEGGMGTVYKARHQTMGRVVALKVIRKERLNGPNAVKRFQREVRAAAQLHHPHIVLAYDADEAGGNHFLAMQYVEGSDLARLVKERGALPVGTACDYVRQAALGLQHAFERGMVHRDIKPHNLLLASKTSTAGAGMIKLLDMGLARLTPADGAESSGTLTEDGAVLGTTDYIAPEQALGAHDVDIRADLYSLGCTFYFLLTGRPPFPGGTLGAKLMAHQFQEPEPIEKLRPNVPPSIVAVVRKLMAKKPADRFQTPADLAAALPATAIQVKPGIAAGAADIPAAVPLAATTATVDDETIASPDAAGPSPQRARRRFRLALLLAPCVAVLGIGASWSLFWVFKGPSSPDISKLTPGSLSGRSGAVREELVRWGGGNQQSEEAVARGLKWIAAQQKDNGRWSIVRDDPKATDLTVGATALGLLPLLGVGGDYQNGVYQKNIERGLSFLLSQQKDDGGFADNMYLQGLATIALCEAYGLKKEERTREAAQRAVNYIVKAQHAGGGWRYKPGQEGDTSVTGWQFMALQTARRVGLDVPQDTISKVSLYLDSVALPDGMYRYQPTSPPPGGIAVTAIALLCRLNLGMDANRPEITRGIGFVKQSAPSPTLENAYYYYYATQVMYHAGGDDWNFWNPRMRDLLIGKQDPDGSWSPVTDAWGKAGGRLMVTSLSLLTLEVYYRHVPFCIGKAKPIVASNEKEIDLLKLIDPKIDSVRGTWRFDGSALVSPPPDADAQRLQLRYPVPEEYALTMQVERSEGTSASLGVGLVHFGTRSFANVGTPDDATLNGLGWLDGKLARDNETAYRKAVLPIGKPSTLRFTVRKTGITASCDGVTIVSWQGDFRRLSAPGMADNHYLCIDIWHTIFRFTKIVLTPL